jgi:hypothetical protein
MCPAKLQDTELPGESITACGSWFSDTSAPFLLVAFAI